MWAVLLPPGVNPIAVKYIYHIISISIIIIIKGNKMAINWKPDTGGCTVLPTAGMLTKQPMFIKNF
jgi:hypothetical protein